MSKEIDELKLIAVIEIGKSSQKVQDLITEKNNEINRLEMGQKSNFKKFSPAPKPSGDIRIAKIHTKENHAPEATKQAIQKTVDKFARDLKSAMEEKALETDQDHILPSIQEIEKDDLQILVEQGLDAYKERQIEKEKELEQSLEFDLDDKSNFEDYPIYLDFEANSKDMDIEKAPSPSDDFE